MIRLMPVYVDVLFTCGKCGFNSLGSWSYYKEWTKRNKKYVALLQGSEMSAGWHSRI